MKRLRRYADRERVLKLLDIIDIEDLPKHFFAFAEGNRAAGVSINWLGVRAGLEASFDAFAKRDKSQVPMERVLEAKSIRTRDALFHVLEFLPEVIDAAIVNLYLEAFILVAVNHGSPRARAIVEAVARMDYDARIKRLGIHEGPKARFQNRREYENELKQAAHGLLREGREITQDRIGEKLSAGSTGSSELLDGRMIRKWNTEFGVNWKSFIKKLKADKS